MGEKPDAELVALARSGHREAFGQLVERYRRLAHTVAMGMVANEELARDLVQEAMLQAYLSLHHLRDASRFRSWLFGIVLNVCRSFIRTCRTTSPLEATAGDLHFEALPFSTADPDPQEVTEERELQRTVTEAVAGLSPEDRTVTLLFYYEQFSLREIAALLGVSVVAAKVRLHRARKRLKQRLQPWYVETGRAALTERRRRAMVKVTVVDVVRRKDVGHQVVVLLDESGRRILPIWVGPFEGETIATRLLDRRAPRPLTYEFVASLLAAAEVQLEHVRVETLREQTFYAVARLRSGDRVREVDARPSDAIALALRTGSPIYAAEEVLEAAGAAIPEELGQVKLGRGLDGILKEIEEAQRAAPVRTCPTAEDREKAFNDLIAFVFGRQ